MPRACRPTFVLPGKWRGLVERGNIDICNRPRVWNKREHGYSTVYSISYRVEGLEVLIPQVLTNPPRMAFDLAALRNFERTGEHLGKFRTFKDANRYSDALHRQQARIYPG